MLEFIVICIYLYVFDELKNNIPHVFDSLGNFNLLKILIFFWEVVGAASHFFSSSLLSNFHRRILFFRLFLSFILSSLLLFLYYYFRIITFVPYKPYRFLYGS